MDDFDDEFFEFWTRRRSTDWIFTGKGSLFGDHDTESTEQGVGSDERGQLPTAMTARELGFARRSNPLSFSKASGFVADLIEENAIFFRKVFDHGLLVLVHPAGGGDGSKRRIVRGDPQTAASARIA